MSNGTVSWITLQAADLNDYLVGAQATAVRTAALAGGQNDTWTNVMTDVVNEIRSAIRGGCIKNQTPIVVSQTPLSIPPELKRNALVMIRNALQGRLPSLELTPGQEREHDHALAALNRIQTGVAVVSMPPDPLAPDDQQRAAPVAVVSSERRRFTRRSLRGL